ncbi:hypothetical protein [Persicitalea jodogahamensis]|uniref:Uncharacterized protein n=1 Tax=Persicitalea jodogahamensis TaxID=402147 RepID=A0A8J3D4U2_9BACT|nr:hypothetical protein [Persicitalea jodogahamensis]GHB75529.1 hypothetical protein GCM10007390_31600 [Persicitalea jodogahamensis]
MKTLITFAMACALSLAAQPDARSAADGTNTSTAKSSYVVTDKMAMYMSSGNKLQLRFSKLSAMATVEVLNGPRTLYRNSIDLRKGANQLLDLSQLEAGSYTIQVSIGKQTTTKTLTIGWNSERSFQLS